MHLVITHDHQAAIERIRHKSNKHFGIAPSYKGNDLAKFLKALPTIDKSALIAYGETFVEQNLTDAILFSETSGTTSLPLQTPRSKTDLGWNVFNQMVAYKLLVQPGVDRMAILHPSVLSPFIEASALALHNLGVGYVRIFPIPGICDYVRIFEVIKRYRITSIMSTPSLIYKLLYELKRIDNGRLPSSLKKIFATGERFSPESARNIERILGPGSCALPFVYGSSETATVMVGDRDCSYRPIAEDFVFEIINEKSIDENYVTGSLIVTWLRDGVLPIIRYDTGDVFTAIKSPSNEHYRFVFEGRATGDGLSCPEQCAVEAALYSLSRPIYHFELIVDKRLRAVSCGLITEPTFSVEVSEAEESLKSAESLEV